jgi:signal transduction histidine kinase
MGSSTPYELQNHHANVPSFPFKLMPNQTDTFYLYLFQRDMPISTPIALTTGEGIVAIELLYRSGIISGFALAYVLCALGMFWFTKKPLYFAYFVYTLGAFGYFMATQGIGYIWLWSNHFGFETVSEATFGTLMMVGFMFTTIHFFELECSFPNIHKILKTFLAFSLFFIGVGLFRNLFPCGTYYYISILGLCVCVMGLCLVFLVAVLSYFRFKRREAFYFLMGFSLFIASVIATILHELGMLEVDNWFFQTLPHLSLFVEFTIFMGILANRLKNEWLTRKQTEWRLQREMQEQSQRISQDLHDEVGSALNSISVFSEVAKYQIQQIQPNVVPILNQIGETARTLSATLNDIVWIVNPKSEPLENMMVKMQLFAADLLMSQHVTIDFQCHINDATQLNMEQRKAFYLLFKEAINNVYKHAVCSDLKIHIQQVENQICMTIEDNGNGFDLKSSSVGNGLSTMRERAKILKSLLIIQTAVDEGCIMVLSFPIQC